jgi:chemotaxis protein MotB
MVVIFIVLVFTVSHFYLGYALEGRDAAVERLNRQVGELADMLALERSTAAEQKASNERLTLALDGANRSRATLEGQLAALMAERDDLSRQLTERTGERDRAQADLAQRSTEATAARDLAGTEARATAWQPTSPAWTRRRRRGARSRPTRPIEAQLRDLARLARDLEHSAPLRADLERRSPT